MLFDNYIIIEFLVLVRLVMGYLVVVNVVVPGGRGDTLFGYHDFLLPDLIILRSLQIMDVHLFILARLT